jgi:tetratricopeptide (TPR) repeat protein
MQDELQAMLPPGSQKEMELLIGVGRNVALFPKMSRAEQNDLLRALEAYECLGQVVKLLDWRIQRASVRDGDLFSEFLWLMRIYYLGMEDFDKFTETAARAVKLLSLPFAIVRIHIAEGILGAESFHEHALFYARILGSFSKPSQQALLLERLALIYEKKIFLDDDVDAVYAKLIEVDPNNIKALKFYKFFYMQTSRFREAAAQLEKLLRVMPNPFERQRAAHELAQIHLYNLNEPAKAREILEQHCSHSQLDIDHTLIEALDRLGAVDELVAFLRKISRDIVNEKEKAVLELRVSASCFKAARFEEARDAAVAALSLNPDSFLAHESLLSAQLELGDVSGIVGALERLKGSVRLDSSRMEIDKLMDRGRKLLRVEESHV